MSGSRLHVEIDQELCVCSQACAAALPEVFEPRGYDMTVIQPDAPADLARDLSEVQDMCPTGAITVTTVPR